MNIKKVGIQRVGVEPVGIDKLRVVSPLAIPKAIDWRESLVNGFEFEQGNERENIGNGTLFIGSSAGIFKYGGIFQGHNYLEVRDGAGLSLSTDYSRPPNNEQDRSYVLAFRNIGSDGTLFENGGGTNGNAVFLKNNQIYVRSWDSEKDVILSDGVVITNRSWTILVYRSAELMVDGDDLFINGNKKEINIPRTGNLLAGGDACGLGRVSGTSRPQTVQNLYDDQLSADIAFLHIYNRLLTDEECIELSSAHLVGDIS